MDVAQVCGLAFGQGCGGEGGGQLCPQWLHMGAEAGTHGVRIELAIVEDVREGGEAFQKARGGDEPI